VAEDLAMDRTSLYRALAALAKQHWVTLSDGADSRSRTASVTRQGQAALARAQPGWESTQRALIDRFGAAQWQTLVAELRRLADCACAVKTR
jgi:DNA-binding MarR family transcriptional regulator